MLLNEAIIAWLSDPNKEPMVKVILKLCILQVIGF